MAKIETAKEVGTKNQKMTLKGYFLKLPNVIHPKTDFMNKVAQEANVSVSTVRNWVKYGMRPKNREHIDVLVRVTGIPADRLWED